MPDGHADEVREALLAKAAQAWEDDPALDPRTIGDGSGDDSVSGYLGAYYQRVATEDLAAPSRLAAVAEAHARLGLSRPQGRARVQVRAPADAQLHPVGRSGLVVDIVTDDMPYLVDSVTTELNRHEAEIRLLVHPLLRVHRDVTGALRGILGVCGDVSSDTPGEPAAGEITESWIHVELGPPRDKVTADQLEADLRHVLDDVRVAAEDQPRMEAVARRAGRPARRGARQRRGRARRPAPLAGGRQLPLPRLPRIRLRADRGGHGPARCDRHWAWHPPPRPAGAGGRAQDVLSGAGPGADPDERLVLAKANSRSTVYRANYLDYVSVKKLGPDGQGGQHVTGEYRFLGLYSHAAHIAPIGGMPVLRRKLDQVLATAGLSADSHDGQELVEILEATRARSCSRSRRRSSLRSLSAC